MLIDSHCHLDDTRFAGQQAALISAAAGVGVTHYVVPTTGADNWPLVAELAANFSAINAAYGLHPWFVDHHPQNASAQLAQWLDRHPAVAIGECGLDFGRPNPTLQQALFAEQIKLAAEAGLPLIVHAHKALDAVIQLLRKYPGVRGVIHRFTGSLQQGLQLVDLGFYIGVAAGITYPNQVRLRKAIANVPLTSLLLESDAPDLPPAGTDAPLNAPQYLPRTLASLAELLDSNSEQVAQQTTLNSQTPFGISVT